MSRQRTAHCRRCGAELDPMTGDTEEELCINCAEKHGVGEEGKLKCYWCAVDPKVEDGRLLEEARKDMAKSPHYDVMVRSICI